MQWALYQAELLIRSGRCKTVLVGCHDEMAPLFAKFMSMAGFAPEPEVASTAIVLRAVKNNKIMEWNSKIGIIFAC